MMRCEFIPSDLLKSQRFVECRRIALRRAEPHDIEFALRPGDDRLDQR